MSALDLIYGNEQLKNIISGFSSRSSFPNAFIISGAEGSGKSLIAKVCAMAIACQGKDTRPCSNCPACKKIMAEISPDVITLAREKDRKTIGIDAVRELKESAYVLPNDLSVKIYIIDEAHRLTEQAQNALLKLFEEGPGSVYFILLTDRPSSLLTTVRSRAPELKAERFSEGKLTSLLLENEKKAVELSKKDPVAFKRLLSASDGSYGKALSILEGKNKKSAKAYLRAEELISYIATENDSELLLGLISESSDRENYVNILRLILTGIRDLILLKKGSGGASSLLFADEDKGVELSNKFSLTVLISMAEALSQLINDAQDININLRNAAIVAFNSIKDCK